VPQDPAMPRSRSPLECYVNDSLLGMIVTDAMLLHCFVHNSPRIPVNEFAYNVALGFVHENLFKAAQVERPLRRKWHLKRLPRMTTWHFCSASAS
jgi:hypothetical protein